MSLSIAEQVRKLGPGPLTEDGLREHIWPLFSRVLAREDIYLANHSLGRPLDRMVEDVVSATNAWYEDMDDAWMSWMDEINTFRIQISLLIGHPNHQLISPKASAGQGLRAVLNTFEKAPKVTSTRGEFDSIDFILKTYEMKGRAELSWIQPSPNGLFETEEVIKSLPQDADLLVISQTVFNTGQILVDLKKIIQAAHQKGIWVLVDAYHAAGVIPIQMVDLDADFMIGGSYKYARGGPGAGWLAIHPRHAGLRTLDTGWFAKKDTFGYERSDIPEFDDAWLESTPPILPVYQARSGLEFTLEIGVDRLREYSLKQLEYLREALRSQGVRVVIPDQPSKFGAFALVESNDSAVFCRKLKEGGVNVDARSRFVRFGPDILNSTEELTRAAEIAGRFNL